MLIIVNTAFDEHEQNSDEQNAQHTVDGTVFDNAAAQDTIGAQDIEMAVISINESLNSSNEINESPIDGEEMDTSDNNTTNNTQTTAECDDRLLPIEPKHMRNGSGSSNYDDDYEADENLSIGVDELRKHNGDYGLQDVQNADETRKLVNGGNSSETEDCDYYSDGDNDGDGNGSGNGDVKQGRGDILKFNGGDGIIANHFIGLYISISVSNVDLFINYVINCRARTFIMWRLSACTWHMINDESLSILCKRSWFIISGKGELSFWFTNILLTMVYS